MIAYRSVEGVYSNNDVSKFKEYLVSINGNYYAPRQSGSSFDSLHVSEYNDVYVGKYVTSCNNMLSYCADFNNNVYIGENVIFAEYALDFCTNFSSHIYFKGNTLREFRASGMLHFAGIIDWDGNYYNKYLHCHKNFAPAVYNANLFDSYSPLSWTPLSDNNGWYNSTYNIYLYNNYSG